MEVDKTKILRYFLSKKINPIENIGLYTGISGEILFLTHCYLYNKNNDIIDKINSLLDLCINKISNENIYHNFSSGLAGFGWVVNYLIESNIIETNSKEFLSGINPVLKDSTIKLLDDNIDLLNGALSIGNYFLRVNDREIISHIVDHLEQTKVTKDKEVFWSFKKTHFNDQQMVDMSLSHGVAGVLYFLIRAYNLNIERVKCKILIEGCLEFFRNNYQNYDYTGSYFSNLVPLNEYLKGPNGKEVKSRLGWCYGDLTILYMMHHASIAIGKFTYMNETLDKLLNTCIRFSQDDTKVCEAGFCHGSIGNAFIYNDLYNKTNHKKFKTASEYWVHQTLLYNLDKSHSVPKYLFIGGKDFEPLANCDNLLEGLLGVGFVFNVFLMKRKSEKIPHFNDAFMLL